MKVRSKLMMLMLAVALLPLLAVSAVDLFTLRHAGARLVRDARDEQRRVAEQELRHTIDRYSEYLDRERRLVETALLLQADAVNDRLHRTQPQQTPVRTYFSDDIPGPPDDHTPPGLVDSTRHGRWDQTLRVSSPRPITFDTQVFHVVKPASPASLVEQQVGQLGGLNELYRSLRDRLPPALLWQTTTLESGLQSTYPGRSGFDADYDPRRSESYLRTDRQRGVVSWWTSVDPATNLVTLTATTPVYDNDGAFAGVTAMSLVAHEVLMRKRLAADWANHAELTMVGVQTPGDPGSQLTLIAQTDVDPSLHTDWRPPGGNPLVLPDRPAQQQAIMLDIAAGKSKVHEVTIEGEPSYWAHGPISPDRSAFLVVVVPQRAVVRRAQALETELRHQMAWMIATGVGAFVLAGLLVMYLAWKSSRIVTAPVISLAQAAEQVASGDLEARVAARESDDEIAQMANGFNSMVPKLRDRVRIRESLALAMQVQQSLLPQQPPAFPGLDIAGRSLYCDETGGDYFDFIPRTGHDSPTLGVVVGDVVGHGVAAALLMATVRGVLRLGAKTSANIEDDIAGVNDHLCESQFTGRFMTLFYLSIQADPLHMRWVSAGHDPAFVYDPRDDAFDQLVGEDIPLGVRPGWHYHAFERDHWQPGQIILIGTDGIWECRNPQGDMFGKQRLKQLIRENASRTAEDICEAVDGALRDFRARSEQLDDMTLVVLKITDDA